MSGQSTSRAAFRRLLPPGPVVDAEELGGGVALGEARDPDRPLLALNMIASADGKATMGGRTAALGNAADRALFHTLRAGVDGVLVGAGTVRAERYGRLVRDADVRRQREQRDLRPEPLAAVVSASLELPADLPLLREPEAHVAVLTPSAGELAPVPARVDYVRIDGERPARGLAGALRELRERFGVRSLLCEGGPRLNGWLFEAGVVDELFVSTAPLVVGAGESLSIVEGPALRAPARLEPVWLAESEGCLFARYRVVGERDGSRA